MTDPTAMLRRVVGDLESDGLDFALVGGLAISIRAEPRLTQDRDFAVSVADDNAAEGVVAGLIRRGYAADMAVEQDVTGRLATVRLTGPAPDASITDLLFASCGVEPEIVAAAERLEVLPGLALPVARTGHLIAMKLLARDDRQRPADYDDLRSLASVSEDDDWATAAEAVELIVGRGYGRGRDLASALGELRVGWAEW